MPTGVYVRTAFHKKKISEGQKGKTPYLRTDEIRRHMSEAQKKIGDHKGRFRKGEHMGKDNARYWLGKKRPNMTGPNSPFWKGDNIGYRAIHCWIAARMGKPHTCDDCGNSKLKHRQYHWANISGKYKRDITDWKRLCATCHAKFDKITGYPKSSWTKKAEKVEKTNKIKT